MDPLRKRFRLYLETSVWSYTNAHRFPQHLKATLRLLEEVERGGFEGFVSDIVLAEMKRTPNQAKLDRMYRALAQCKPTVLEKGDEAEQLAEEYVQQGVIPEAARLDAVHVAIATVEGLDAVVSWNMRHIVRLETRLGIQGVNRMNGYHEIDLCTPEEVAHDQT